MREYNDNEKRNIDHAYSLMGRKLDMQHQGHNTLESKIGILLGFVGAIAGSAILLVEKTPKFFGLNIFTLGLAGVYLTLIFLVLALRIREYMNPPDFPAFLSEEALAKSEYHFKAQALSDMKESYLLNAKADNDKARYYTWAIFCFVASILLLFLGILEK